LEQPKKPGARDISDLKARLGLNRGPAAPRGAPAAAPHPFAPPGAVPMPVPVPGAIAPSPATPPPAHDPYASMRPPAGQQFDLRPVDDGVPVENMRRGGVKALFVVGLIMAVAGGALGVGFGIGMSGRRAYNVTNAGAKRVKAELEEMHKTVTLVGQAVAISAQRLQAERKDRLAYDPNLIEELAKIKLDPRPDTSKMFKVDYYRLPDIAVDNMMTYYYDAIALYTEVERHVKRSTADKTSLEAFAAKQTEKGQASYGVVFAGGGKMVLANLVEIGAPVCKGGGSDCSMDQLDGFQIRSNTGSNWVTRKVGAKPEGNIVVPLDRTPLLESVMAGSPDQARMEQYRQRSGSIQMLLTRIAQTQKQLMESINQAAARPDLFTL
jgi:hypothetical protein